MYRLGATFAEKDGDYIEDLKIIIRQMEKGEVHKYFINSPEFRDNREKAISSLKMRIKEILSPEIYLLIQYDKTIPVIIDITKQEERSD